MDPGSCMVGFGMFEEFNGLFKGLLLTPRTAYNEGLHDLIWLLWVSDSLVTGQLGIPYFLENSRFS